MTADSKPQVFVPGASLPNLCCSVCKKFLSYFPVYSHSTLGSICGRCTIPTNENLFRNQIYETAVQFQKFPCVYQSNGCLENLFPADVPQHEKICAYKKHECPTKMYNNCTWQGYLNEILEHFEAKHPTFILRECRFEVDFVNNHSENYIMPYGEDLYIVTREANPNQNTFSCEVVYVGTNSSIENYSYTLTLESANKEHKHIVSQDMNKKLELTGSSLKEILNNPTNVIAIIEITANENEEFVDACDQKKKTNINLEQLKELECPVCFKYMISPIVQCMIGHSFCETCVKDQIQCPTCQGPFNKTNGTRNFTLENIVEFMIYPCKHENCSFTTTAKDIRQHEAFCIYGPLQCPLKEYDDCSMQMAIFDMYEHISQKHLESILDLDIVSIPFEEGDKLEECYIIKDFQRLFRLCFLCHDGLFYWSVQLIGPADESAKYKFTLEIIDNSNDQWIYFKKACSPFCDKDSVFAHEKVDNYIFLEYDHLKKLITQQLTYRIRILSK